MRPAAPCEVLTPKQRLYLFHETSCSAEEALAFEEADITLDLLIAKGVHARNMSVAGVGPSLLKRMGCEDCATLRSLGFDALHLADVKFATEANAMYGARAVVKVFLACASDAVSVAGTAAANILGIHARELLAACAGAPTEAHAVLQQLSPGVALEGVDARTLLDTGLRKAVLAELSYSLASVASQTNATAAELAKLGYTLNCT